MQGSPVKNTELDDIVSLITSSERPLELKFRPEKPMAISPPKPKINEKGAREYTLKETGPVGFTMALTVDDANKMVPCIAEIEKGEVASAFDSLKRFDYILSVDGVSTIGLTLEKVTELMSNRPCNLQVSSPDKAYKFHQFSAGPLGITLRALPGLPGAMVQVISPEGQAGIAFKTLQEGDMVEAVGTVATGNLTFDDIYNIVSTSPRPIIFKFKTGTRQLRSQMPPPPPPRERSTFGYTPVEEDMFRPEMSVRNQILEGTVRLNNTLAEATHADDGEEEKETTASEEEDTGNLTERSTEEKLRDLMYCQPSSSLPSTYMDEHMEVSLIEHANGVCINEVKNFLRMQNKGEKSQRRMSSLLNIADEDNTYGNWSNDSERKRAGQPFLSYIPARFLRTRLRAFDEFKPNEMLISYQRYLRSNFDKQKITFLRLEKVDSSDIGGQNICSLISQMPNVQCLILRKCNLASTAQMKLPKLLYCDLQQNALRAVADLTPMVNECMYIQYLDLRGNVKLVGKRSKTKWKGAHPKVSKEGKR